LLTAYGGTQDPLFKRVILQSITHENKYNRTGGLEDMTKAVAKGVGCVGRGAGLIACMRKADGKALADVNRKIAADAPLGTFPFGSAVSACYISYLLIGLQAGFRRLVERANGGV
jgi:hypothetical protein